MARQPRFGLVGYPQHVIQRGNNRQACFFAERDYTFYLEKLADACAKHGCDVHAYVLMTNHVHLLVTPHATDSVPRMMQTLGRNYVRYINDTYRRSGTLWEGRYKAALVDSNDYVLTCYRYIELNPVRARMCDAPAQYRWSSYGANALGNSDAVIAPHSAYQALSIDSAQRRGAYRALFEFGLDEETLQRIRNATNGEWALGNARFAKEVQRHLTRRVVPKKNGAGVLVSDP